MRNYAQGPTPLADDCRPSRIWDCWQTPKEEYTATTQPSINFGISHLDQISTCFYNLALPLSLDPLHRQHKEYILYSKCNTLMSDVSLGHIGTLTAKCGRLDESWGQVEEQRSSDLVQWLLRSLNGGPKPFVQRTVNLCHPDWNYLSSGQDLYSRGTDRIVIPADNNSTCYPEYNALRCRATKLFAELRAWINFFLSAFATISARYAKSGSNIL
ncbi:hypothetical protein DFH06DRAFT_1141433 [Mycena polygramma]|nr:hypothetical protein DFH06DRAFT_1141433 [Mycena polygramma]